MIPTKQRLFATDTGSARVFVNLGVSGWVAMRMLQQTVVPGDAFAHGQTEYVFRGLSFQNQEGVREFLQELRSTRMCPWSFELPDDVIPLVACIGCGIVGGAARLLKVLTQSATSLTARSVFGDPVYGAVIGVTIVFLAWALPSLLTTGKGPVRPESLVAFALCGGMFSKQASAWLEQASQRIFQRQKGTND